MAAVLCIYKFKQIIFTNQKNTFDFIISFVDVNFKSLAIVCIRILNNLTVLNVKQSLTGKCDKLALRLAVWRPHKN